MLRSPPGRPLELGPIHQLSRLLSRKCDRRNALEYSDKETATSNQRRQERPGTKGMAGRKHPQTRSNISTQGTTQSRLRPRIRPGGTSNLSRKQVCRIKLNLSNIPLRIFLVSDVMSFSQQ